MDRDDVMQMRSRELTYPELLGAVDDAIGHAVTGPWGPVHPPGEGRARAFIEALHRSEVQVIDRITARNMDDAAYAKGYEAGMRFGRRAWQRVAFLAVGCTIVALFILLIGLVGRLDG